MANFFDPNSLSNYLIFNTGFPQIILEPIIFGTQTSKHMYFFAKFYLKCMNTHHTALYKISKLLLRFPNQFDRKKVVNRFEQFGVEIYLKNFVRKIQNPGQITRSSKGTREITLVP